MVFIKNSVDCVSNCTKSSWLFHIFVFEWFSLEKNQNELYCDLQDKLRQVLPLKSSCNVLNQSNGLLSLVMSHGAIHDLGASMKGWYQWWFSSFRCFALVIVISLITPLFNMKAALYFSDLGTKGFWIIQIIRSMIHFQNLKPPSNYEKLYLNNMPPKIRVPLKMKLKTF